MDLEDAKILLYCWGSIAEKPLYDALKKMNIKTMVFEAEMKDYHADSNFAVKFINIIHAENINAVFSYNYFPLISMICHMNNIPYISWIYDCPLLTLYSKTVVNPCNFIFSFDEILAERLRGIGAKNAYSMPLAGNAALKDEIEDSGYIHDISFVGNLYNDKNNRILNAKLSDRTRGYIEGIANAQRLIYGYNFIRECLNDNVMNEIVNKCELSLNPDMYYQDEGRLAADAICREVSRRERESVVSGLAGKYKLDFYTTSEVPDSMKSPNLIVHGGIDYGTEMPRIFKLSRINLNITSCTIESGIPLRVFDILSAGGFCLTNYRPEIAECFEDGAELVMFSGMEDLEDKVEYYLVHEKERRQIAERVN